MPLPPKKPKPIDNKLKPLANQPPRPLSQTPKPLKPSSLSQQSTPQTNQQTQSRSLKIQADQLFEMGEIEEAFKVYHKLCLEGPASDNHPFKQICRCYRQIAKGFRKEKKYQKVVDLLEEMFELCEGREQNFKALDYKILGECYLKLGQFEEAQEAIEDALYLEPNMLSAQELLKELKAEQVTRRLTGLKDLPYDSFED